MGTLLCVWEYYACYGQIHDHFWWRWFILAGRYVTHVHSSRRLHFFAYQCVNVQTQTVNGLILLSHWIFTHPHTCTFRSAHGDCVWARPDMLEKYCRELYEWFFFKVSSFFLSHLTAGFSGASGWRLSLNDCAKQTM